jgi:hypothetical protein
LERAGEESLEGLGWHWHSAGKLPGMSLGDALHLSFGFLSVGGGIVSKRRYLGVGWVKLGSAHSASRWERYILGSNLLMICGPVGCGWDVFVPFWK